MKIGLEKEIKDLDAEIKLRRYEAKRLLTLESKVKAQRHIKDLEKKRSEKRKSLFVAQDDIDNRKEALLTTIESRLKQNLQRKELFTLRWMVT
jgi:poly-D-alanine transfer protein DltD